MKKKNIVIISVLIVLAISIFGIGYYALNRPDKDTTLTILENRWIESNKNNLIDLSIVNQVPVLNYNGSGLIFDFLNSLEKDTGLSFNKVSITATDTPKTEYAIMATNQLMKNDLLFYEDCYAILTKEGVKYNRLSDIKGITLGVLDSDLENVNKYLQGSVITLKTYDKVEDLIASIGTDTEAITLPKTTYLETIIKEDFTIAYNITEYPIYYVLRLGKTERLNTILKKYYKKWYNENYESSYNTYLSSTYFNFKDIDDKEKAKFKGKRYVYGFVNDAPYDIMVGSKLRGYNSSFLKELSLLADIEISFQEYHSISSMIKDFNANKIDLMFDNYEPMKYSLDVMNTVSTYDEKIVIISHNSEPLTINSLASLESQKVMTIKNTVTSYYLKASNVKVEEYDSLDKLIKNVKKNSIIALDYENYKYYKDSKLKKYKIDYMESLVDDYSFVIRDIKDNKVFGELFNFYLSFVNEKTVLTNSFYNLSKEDKSSINGNRLVILFSTLVIFIIAIIGYLKLVRGKTRNKKISKEDKLRYIDSLTSLKNRVYLNDNIEKWDSSEVYPQAIIIVDLNNIAYINDNYGHQEGDNVIKEAANILIRGQIENSDIIRTNGNEFLIYLVGYDEKQVVAYNRKLNKELKELSHGFGAASGYSMINDAIKTIDDAVNEATLDMRNNKEELNN
ncbi:MAG: diguanylate cyclase [Bacilli bacterium]|nr:diguanylate cyclase [Bacilli bacterium]